MSNARPQVMATVVVSRTAVEDYHRPTSYAETVEQQGWLCVDELEALCHESARPSSTASAVQVGTQEEHQASRLVDVRAAREAVNLNESCATGAGRIEQ
jgi:hypothetical protein